MDDIKEYEIFPVNTYSGDSGHQTGGSFPYSINRLKRILQIFLSLANNNALDKDLNLLKSDGSKSENADLGELLALTQTKQDRITGLEDFVYQLMRANIDLNLIMNSNIKERLRAFKEKNQSPKDPPQPPAPDHSSAPPPPPPLSHSSRASTPSSPPPEEPSHSQSTRSSPMPYSPPPSPSKSDFIAINSIITFTTTITIITTTTFTTITTSTTRFKSTSSIFVVRRC